jgi:hypothetical protein
MLGDEEPGDDARRLHDGSLSSFHPDVDSGERDGEEPMGAAGLPSDASAPPDQSSPPDTDSGGQVDAAQSVARPRATILFPGISALAIQENLTVRGTAQARAGGTLQSVSVNGAPATSSDGFRSWRAETTLSPGQNDLRITVTDDQEQSDVTMRIRYAGNALVKLGADLKSDSQSGYLAVVPHFLQSVVAVDPRAATRRWALAPRPSTGALDYYHSVLRLADDELLVAVASSIEPQPTSYFVERVKISTRSTLRVLSGQFQRLVRASGDDVLAIGPSALVRIRVSDNSTRVISGYSPDSGDVGTGPKARWAVDAMELNVSTIIVVDNQDAQLLSVDVASGNRTVLSSAARGHGPALTAPVSGVVIAGRVLVLDSGRILAVDPATGDRSLVSGALAGTGPLWLVGTCITTAANGQVALLDNSGLGSVFLIDPVTGARQLEHSFDLGAGPSILGTGAGALERSGNLVLFDQGKGNLTRVDTETGARTVLASVAAGVTAVESVSATSLLLGHGDGHLSRFDTITGGESVLSSASLGSGVAITTVSDMALGPSGFLYVADGSSLLTFNVANSERRLVGQLVAKRLAFDPSGMLFGLAPNLVEVSTSDASVRALTSWTFSDTDDLAAASSSEFAVIGRDPFRPVYTWFVEAEGAIRREAFPNSARLRGRLAYEGDGRYLHFGADPFGSYVIRRDTVTMQEVYISVSDTNQ